MSPDFPGDAWMPFSAPSKSNSSSSLSSSSSPRLSACFLMSERRTFRESVARHMMNPASVVVSSVLVSYSNTCTANMCDCAFTRFARLCIVSFTEARSNASSKPSTVTVPSLEKQFSQMGITTSGSTLAPFSRHSNRSASASAATETSRWSPKCSSQNRRESACLSLFDVRVLKLCSCVACTSDSMCLRSSSSVFSSSFSASRTSLPLLASFRQRQSPPPFSACTSDIFMSLSRRSFSSSTQLLMLSRITLMRLSSMLSPSSMPSTWSSRREHRVAV